MTLLTDSLASLQQLRADIAPGISGWDRDAEETSFETLLGAAMAAQGITLATVGEAGVLAVRNEIIPRMIAEVTPTVTLIDEAEDRWKQAPGQLNSALSAVESDLIQAVADEAAGGEPAVASASGPGKGKGQRPNP